MGVYLNIIRGHEKYNDIYFDALKKLRKNGVSHVDAFLEDEYFLAVSCNDLNDAGEVICLLFDKYQFVVLRGPPSTAPPYQWIPKFLGSTVFLYLLEIFHQTVIVIALCLPTKQFHLQSSFGGPRAERPGGQVVGDLHSVPPVLRHRKAISACLLLSLRLL